MEVISFSNYFMKNQKNIYTRGVIPIIAIIAGLVALGGAGAVLTYIMNNEATLRPAVEEARSERAAQAQAYGYPSLWVGAGLPEYSNGSLTKTREGRNLNEGVQVTIETSDPMLTVTSFWKDEMIGRGFSVAPGFPGTEYATMITYKSGTKTLKLTITKIGEGPNNKIHAVYAE